VTSVAWFLVGFALGGAIAAWGAWLGYRDNVRRYFLERDYSPARATEEANRAMGIEMYDPRQNDNK